MGRTMPRRNHGLQLLLSGLLLAACAPNRWDGQLVRAGSLDLAVRPLGVSLMGATREHTYGLGLLEHAAGVAIVIDGQVSLGRALSPTHARTDPGFAPGMGASWIVQAEVPRWREETLREDLDFEGLARRVAELGRQEGWPTDRPLLFLVEGPLEAVSASIVRGAPPGAAPTPGTEPFRTSLRRAEGVLVGVYAPGGTGTFVLPGDDLRVHAFLRQPTHLVATLDAARIQKGARLRVPRGQ
jgi:hypothetical protein